MSLKCGLLGHRWRPQAVKHHALYRTTTARGEGEDPACNMTRVLRRCERCPALSVQELEGHWTLAQLLLGEEMRDPSAGKVRT